VEALRRRWTALWRGPWTAALPVLAVQLVSGLWYMPQNSFFPIYLEERLGYAPLVIASLVSASQVAGSIGGVLGGVLSDALGSKWVLVLGLACAAMASLAFVTAEPWLVALLWIIGGLAVGFHTLGGSSYLTKVADRRYLGVLSAFYDLNLTLGGALGNPVVGVILEARGFGVFGTVLFALVLATLVGTLLFVPALRRQDSDVAADRASQRNDWQESWTGALALLRRPLVALLLALRFLPTVLYATMGTFIPLLINRIAGHKTIVAAYATVSLIGASSAQLAAGRAADRFGRRLPTLVSLCMLILAGMGLAAFADRLWGVFAFGVLGISAAWALASLMLCLVSDNLPADEHGRVLGLLHGIWSLGMVAGATLGGALIRVATGLPFLVAALLNIGSVFLLLAFFARARAIAAERASVDPAER
jgi:MFS family permease